MHLARHKVLLAYRRPSLQPIVSYFVHKSAASLAELCGIGLWASAVVPCRVPFGQEVATFQTYEGPENEG